MALSLYYIGIILGLPAGAWRYRSARFPSQMGQQDAPSNIGTVGLIRPCPRRSVGKEPLGGRAGHTGTDRGRDKRLGFSHHPPNATSIRVRLHLLGLPRGTHHGITIPQANRVIVIEQMKHLLD